MGIIQINLIYELDSAHAKYGVEINGRISVAYSTGWVECWTKLAFNTNLANLIDLNVAFYIFNSAIRFGACKMQSLNLALNFFLGLCDYLDKFFKTFCSSCGIECPSTANFCHQCGEQLNLSQVSNKAASSRGYPFAAIVSLLEKNLMEYKWTWGCLKGSKKIDFLNLLKTCSFLLSLTLITRCSFIILNFICAR